MARTRRQLLGQRQEGRALRHLRAAGLTLITRNFRSRCGEIDLVTLDADCLVFVEVRYRRPGRTTAVETVDEHKCRRLQSAAEFFLAGRPALASQPVRFDVVAIDEIGWGRTSLRWIRDAFRPDD